MRFIFSLLVLAIIAKVVWNDGSLLNGLLLFGSMIIWFFAIWKVIIDPDFWSIFVAIILPLTIIFLHFFQDFLEYWPPISKRRHIKMNDDYVKNGFDPSEWPDLSIEEYNRIVEKREAKRRKRFWYYWF